MPVTANQPKNDTVGRISDTAKATGETLGIGSHVIRQGERAIDKCRSPHASAIDCVGSIADVIPPLLNDGADLAQRGIDAAKAVVPAAEPSVAYTIEREKFLNLARTRPLTLADVNEAPGDIKFYQVQNAGSFDAVAKRMEVSPDTLRELNPALARQRGNSLKKGDIVLSYIE